MTNNADTLSTDTGEEIVNCLKRVEVNITAYGDKNINALAGLSDTVNGVLGEMKERPVTNGLDIDRPPICISGLEAYRRPTHKRGLRQAGKAEDRLFNMPSPMLNALKPAILYRDQAMGLPMYRFLAAVVASVALAVSAVDSAVVFVACFVSLAQVVVSFCLIAIVLLVDRVPSFAALLSGRLAVVFDLAVEGFAAIVVVTVVLHVVLGRFPLVLALATGCR